METLENDWFWFTLITLYVHIIMIYIKYNILELLTTNINYL